MSLRILVLALPLLVAAGPALAQSELPAPHLLAEGELPSRSFDGFPDASTTGVSDGVSLRSSGSMTVSQSGAVIDGLNVSGRIKIEADNVTIRNTRIDAGGGRYGIENWGSSGLRVEDVEIMNASSAGLLSFGGVTARRLHIHDSTDGAKLAGNSLLEDSYIHDLRDPSGDSHSDAIQIRFGRNIVLRGNNLSGIIGSKSPHSAGSYGTSAAIIQAKDGPIHDLTVEGNRLEGGQFTFYLTSPSGNGTTTPTRIRNNTWIRGKWGYGPTSFKGQDWTGSACLEWVGNRYDDGGSLSAPAGAHTTAGACN